MAKIQLTLFLIILSSFPYLIYGWGVDGHKITAQIAWNQLSSSGQQGVVEFITSSYSLAEIAPWPDSYRQTPQGAWSEPCHFVNLPQNATYVDMDTDCPDFCVVKSIQNYTNILQGETPFHCDFTQGDEPCALEFLTHFLGDVHQPLHISYESDRGGNDVKVSFFGKDTNLHSVWDTYIIDKWNNDWQSAASDLQDYIDQNPNIVDSYTKDMDPLDWADESFDYVRSTCYNFTEGSQSGTIYLGDVYYDRNLPIVQQRLIAGGLRLAAVFDNIFQLSKNVKININ